jgi:FMN-dependent NADH-azoreductase
MPNRSSFTNLLDRAGRYFRPAGQPRAAAVETPSSHQRRSTMPTLLAIGVSPRYEYSTSRKLTSLFVEKWKAAHPGGQVIDRDLIKTHLPFVDLPWIGGAYTPSEQHSPESAAAIKVSNDLVAELKSADHIVIGTPMYNFSIPAVLKAYIDHIVRVGVTVTPDNVGLLTGKKATIILASGGDFSPGSPVERYNQASGYLRQVLAWIGIKDVDIILAGRARAGGAGETAVEAFGDAVAMASAAEPHSSTQSGIAA